MAEIDKCKLGAAFDRAAGMYDALADLQQRVCARLALALPAMPAARILDGGCGTGNSAEFLSGRWPDAMIAGCDLSLRMLEQARARRLLAVQGDLEQLPFRDAGFDLVWSSLALQWCQPRPAYAELLRVLKPGGKLVFSTLTSGSLRELETVFRGIAVHRRVLPFASVADVEASLHAAGFTALRMRSEPYIARHADFASLLASIRGIGANQSSRSRSDRSPSDINQRRGLMGRQAWQTAQGRYEALRHADGWLPLSYALLFVCAEKPAA